jgi:hypothetical protein
MLESLGRFSCSLYLVHAPIVAIVWTLSIEAAWRTGVSRQEFVI